MGKDQQNIKEKLSPAEFYKLRRPEYFSDSEITYETELPKEQLAFALNQISKNQKHDEFETLCRRLSEKLITPNLIPQVGPTGGGDGKTDSETYPVSKDISDRWFIPENGWNKDEKWAFAFSAKKTWKSKAKDDIINILSTKREYTRIYFITNQTPSSKNKKETQDQYIKEFKLDIVILDGEWILNEIYKNNLINLAVESLNLSEVYKKRKTILGKNDSTRIKRLKEIEDKINNTNNYFENDYQLVEDSIESSILSRMLEKPRHEVEGKFDRAIRYCKKVNNNKQWIRIRYERAWTYINWYNDVDSFISEFKHFKKLISNKSTISEIELYVNLFNLLIGVYFHSEIEQYEIHIDIVNESNELNKILDNFIKDKSKPCTSLIATTYKTFLSLINKIIGGKSKGQIFSNLSSHLKKGENFIEYPFESFKYMIEEMGTFFPTEKEYDNLIETIASISEKRNSELAAGDTFLKRGIQKLDAEQYKESIIYFGKTIYKLAKEESIDRLYMTLICLAKAYESLGLMWASNNCLVSANSISVKSWHQSGIIDKRTYYCTKQLVFNELLLGRLPCFLAWYELFGVLSRQTDFTEDSQKISSEELIDRLLSVRIINTEQSKDIFLSSFPDIFDKLSLWLAQNACLYKLGYIDLILDDFKKAKINDENALDEYYQMVGNQPFKVQMIYDTNFLSGNELCISSTILGSEFIICFENNKEMLLIAETILAFFESFMATSLEGVYPNAEKIYIKLKINKDIKYIKFKIVESSSNYVLDINNFNISGKSKNEIWIELIKFLCNILEKNFFIPNPKNYIDNLFKKEEVNERLSIILDHKNFINNILGNKPKYLFNDWIKGKTIKNYPLKRKEPFSLVLDDKYINMNEDFQKVKTDNIGHNKRKVSSVIDVKVWDKAKWNAFGYLYDPTFVGAIIGFENGEAGKSIFDNWIKNIGKDDINDIIKITIIKGVDKNNPFWYRVFISGNIENLKIKPGDLIYTTSRIHEMNAINSTNLDSLIKGFEKYQQFMLYPATTSNNGKNLIPHFDKAILKHSLTVKNAWEIGENDMERVVINSDDTPVIPKDVEDAPVLQILKNVKISKNDNKKQ